MRKSACFGYSQSAACFVSLRFTCSVTRKENTFIVNSCLSQRIWHLSALHTRSQSQTAASSPVLPTRITHSASYHTGSNMNDSLLMVCVRIFVLVPQSNIRASSAWLSTNIFPSVSDTPESVFTGRHCLFDSTVLLLRWLPAVLCSYLIYVSSPARFMSHV